MKRNNKVSQPALLLMVAGLILAAFTPVLSRYINVPDYLKGFLTGLGLALEFIALVLIERQKNHAKCAKSNSQ